MSALRDALEEIDQIETSTIHAVLRVLGRPELRAEVIELIGGAQVGWRDPSGMLWVTTTPGGPKRDERPVFVFPEDGGQ